MTTTKNTNENINALLLAKMQELLDNQTPHYEGANILVNDALDKWLDTKRVLNMEENGHERYEEKVRLYLKPFFEGKTMLDVSYDDIIDLMKLLKQKGRSNAYIRDAIICIVNPLFREAYEIRRIIPLNPCTGIKTPKVEKVSKTTTATDDEVKALYHAARYEATYGNHYWIAIPLLAMTGMRRGELLGLTWDDVLYNPRTQEWTLRIDKEVISVHNTGKLVHRTKTTEGTRIIAIPALLGKLLMEYREQTQKNEKTFVISQKRNDKFENPRNFHRAFSHWRELSKIREDISPHSFRRLYATQLFLEGVSVDIVKRQGGWKDDRMPFYYADKAQTEPLKAQSAALLGRHWDGAFTLPTVE